ncbi:uncharacterized protein LOC126575247 [Anopheles aquasalis]|uniref:uncharacterized protein LOC126575247 n=1 Tax=Anopheles aquasalis TaxID=42839 RepID=UPI00215A4515|nr:uncharacterized protein LOC126575247 [Anopheles aquasalis]
MSRTGWKTHRYDELPFEILCLIFDRLDLLSLKCASLTCRRWCEIIFSGGYIKRFTLYVSLVRWPVHVKDGHTSPFRRHGEDAGDSKRLILLKAVKRSNRVYRNLTLELEDRSDCNRSATGTLCALLEPHRLEQLVSLRITLKQEAIQLLEMVVKTIPAMSQLRDLRLNGCFSSSTLLRLYSDTVRYLELDTIVPQQLEMPRLHCLNMQINRSAPYYAPARNEDLLYLLMLDSVKELKLTIRSGPIRETHRPIYTQRFYRRLASLETLTLTENSTPENTFVAICDTCTSLTVLSISSLQIIGSRVLQQLSRLSNLRELRLETIVTPYPVSFASFNLPNLESLTVGCTLLMPDTVVMLPPSLRKLVLYCGTDKVREEFSLVVPKLLPHVSEYDFRLSSFY